MDRAEAERTVKQYPTIGACGLDCGLCPRYYTSGKSRCPGCAGPGFFEKHPSCSFITCCVKKRGLEACGECSDFPCSKFKSEGEYQRATPSPSYPPESRLMSNQRFVRKHGVRAFVARQAEKMRLLASLLAEYDDGRSKSFYCRAVSHADLATIRKALAQASKDVETQKVTEMDHKNKARILRALLAKGPPARG